MKKPQSWFKRAFAFLLLLIAWTESASAQSAGGRLTVFLQVVPSTVLIFGDDAKPQIMQANGANGLAIMAIEASAKIDKAVDVTKTNASTTAMRQTQGASQTPVAGAGGVSVQFSVPYQMRSCRRDIHNKKSTLLITRWSRMSSSGPAVFSRRAWRGTPARCVRPLTVAA